MSELKVYHCNEWNNEYTEFYLKSEADEELAKLNRQVKFLQKTHSSCNDCNKCADGMCSVFDESLDKLKKENAYLLKYTKKVINSQKRVIHRQKYKRCLAMAMWCFTKSNYHFVVGRSEGGKNELAHYRISRLYSKWHKRWLKLAEQFKETK